MVNAPDNQYVFNYVDSICLIWRNHNAPDSNFTPLLI